MKISIKWLKDFVDVDLSAPQLIDSLNRIGLLVDDVENRENDVILDLETYANRPDTNGHMGVARELAAVLNKPFKEQSWPLVENDSRTADLITIEIYDEDLCPRYSGIIVKGVKVGPSPDWLKERITAMDLKPINNVVDITNYILYSTAHPIHAFDLAKLSGRKIFVRRANKGEKLRTLEGEDLSLTSDMLVIADEKKPVALAGVIGGEDSAVTGDTQDVFIESACFDPVSVRKTSKKTGIQTDASYRFERGADVSFPPKAALMAASLMTQLNGTATRGITDVYPKPKKNRTVLLRNHRVKELIGVSVADKFITSILTNLGFSLENQQQGIWRVKVPFFRVDIEREADLIEEVARFYGYDKIPSLVPPYNVLEYTYDAKKSLISKIRQILFHHGFDEAVNFSFADPEKEALFQLDREPVEIRNPISVKASILRTTLIGGLLENVAWNLNHEAEGAHFFEIGKAYSWEEEVTQEYTMLGLVTTGDMDIPHWQAKTEKTGFFHLKGACEALLAYLGYSAYSFKESNNPCFEQGHSICITYKGRRIGSLGRVHVDILKAYSLKDPLWAAEINLEVLFEKQPKVFRFTPVGKFPTVTRDLTFITGRDVNYLDIQEDIAKLQLPFLETFGLHDRFEGSPIPKGKVSLSLRFVFRHPRRTLLAEDVETSMAKAIKRLKVKFKIELREGGKIDK
jgi:phenylalanyl-tRNA synthetase beta chain